MIDLVRRRLVSAVTLGALLPPSCAIAAIQPATLFHEQMQRQGINSRELWLTREKEVFRGSYAENGILLRDGYLGACHILRDFRADQSHIIDPAILEILAAINAWLVINKYFRPITVLSGYRTDGTNRSVGGASRSLHKEGRAVDVRIEGIPIKTLARIAKEVSIGGVGIYIKKNFLHLDTGGNRGWGDV